MRPTAEDIRKLLRYDPESGDFVWLVSPSRFVAAGAVAGKIDFKGYRRIKIGRVERKAHHLAWLYMTGAWPTRHMDHADGNRANNAWENLRECGLAENCFNRQVQRNNKTGFKGVCRHAQSGRYQADIRGGKGVKHYLGLFDTADEAAHAYNRAAIQLHGEFARLNPVGEAHA